ncbi:MAG TPA: undecaprenyl-diphosphate phosphatase [Gemmatimonadales bacterium]|nr:undecaprenyl-diphosphate phosphatase [Gemmatimonadales bacterium]
MTLWQGIVLGLVQGLTEFLPVSSSGHLVLVEVLSGIKLPGVFVEVMLHVATLGAVLVVFGGRLWALVRSVARGEPEGWQAVGLLALGTLPAGLIGVLFHRAIEEYFRSLIFLGLGFIVTGFMLWSTRRLEGTKVAPSPLAALGIGLAQAFAILPSVSRSGATVAAALWAGLAPYPAGEYSFLLTVPVIAGAGILEGRHMTVQVAAVGAVSLISSLIVAFVAGIWSIRFLIALLQRGRFYAFAPYCWVVGALTLGYALWHR